MNNNIEVYIVDSFTNERFKGNPAGVCLLNNELEENLMQAIAKELGLSETAFVKEALGDNIYSIRYFSPKMEIPLCGHATLAASKVIFEKLEDVNSIDFKTVENLSLKIRRLRDEIEMKFPVYDTKPQGVPKKLLAALGIDEVANSEFNKETNILLIEINDAKLLQQLSPDFEALKQSHDTINGVLVTACSQKENYDFESRYFWPWSGTNEDPVTGGTHTFLAKYWSLRLNKKKMNSYQCSERTGFMEVELIGDNHMTIKSQAQIVFKGEMRI